MRKRGLVLRVTQIPIALATGDPSVGRGFITAIAFPFTITVGAAGVGLSALAIGVPSAEIASRVILLIWAIFGLGVFSLAGIIRGTMGLSVDEAVTEIERVRQDDERALAGLSARRRERIARDLTSYGDAWTPEE